MRPGDPTRAVFLANGFRMTASVTCLERGNEGEIIRVRSPDGRVFRARISGPSLLEVLPQ
jgi:flagella basal body P-ring formation protein FlgA